ncbi:MAG: CRISPR-associated protein Csx11 [Methanomassiliicoccales archaeon]|nr:CRISPR-associated protein Csx11 [Methanomassiliicoccales archaeon]
MTKNPIEVIKAKREEILMGEIAALLHDIGKMHPDFVRHQSIEKIGQDFDHAKIDGFLNRDLVELLKKQRLEKFNANVDTLIKEHHRGETPLVEFLKVCDRKDSADDKGIVRMKQPVGNTIIASPFGYPKEKIDLECLEKRFDNLQNELIRLFNVYDNEYFNLECLRRDIIRALESSFSHCLGETRIPSNDVTLFDHSFSTASLFKSLLCAITPGEKVNAKNAQWRLFGCRWNGIEFINKGRKAEDILKRSEIIESIRGELKKKFEDEIPIGNAIYEDLDGIFFTFPAMDDSGMTEKLAKTCAEEALTIIKTQSGEEIWPFFLLSEQSKTLTILAKELKIASEKMNFPKLNPILIIRRNEEQKELVKELDFSVNSGDLRKGTVDETEKDICPVCRLRTKRTIEERCAICEERRKGRLQNWIEDREKTIWIDEVADKNNRIALISLYFNISMWQDGTMVGTIFSQSFEDWYNGMKDEKTTPQLLREAGVKNEIRPDKKSVYELLHNCVDGSQECSDDRAATILNTFFEEVSILKNYQNHLNNIKERIGKDKINEKDLATYLFTQNPSPARLYRIWKETEEFFEVLLQEISQKIYSHSWKRIAFVIEDSQFIKKPNENSVCIGGIEGLEPKDILLFYDSDGQFYTIESLGKYKYGGLEGVKAVRDALTEKGLNRLVLESDQSIDLLKNSAKPKNQEFEEYYPFIVLMKSPLSMRFLVPASDSMKIICLIADLYAQRFQKVIGKLPLYVGLLVAKRKFPLYALLEASERLFRDEKFREQVMMSPWWLSGKEFANDYFAYYPVRKTSMEKRYTLDDLETLAYDKTYALYPGYFDFELLLSTADVRNITYENGRRAGEDYKLFSRRPYYFHEIQDIKRLWDILNNNLSSTQINFIEESLTGKLRDWKNLEDSNKMIVFRKFAEVVLKDAFGKKWKEFDEVTRCFVVRSAIDGLLLDTIDLFKHTVKEGGE